MVPGKVLRSPASNLVARSSIPGALSKNHPFLPDYSARQPQDASANQSFSGSSPNCSKGSSGNSSDQPQDPARQTSIVAEQGHSLLPATSSEADSVAIDGTAKNIHSISLSSVLQSSSASGDASPSGRSSDISLDSSSSVATAHASGGASAIPSSASAPQSHNHPPLRTYPPEWDSYRSFYGSDAFNYRMINPNN